MRQLADAINDYVSADADLKGGYFLYYDGEEDVALPLRLVQVHDDRLSYIGDNTYFACADFATADGMIYDVDIFMQGDSADDLEPVQVTIHKVDGVERYTWFEEDGIWVMRDK